MREAGKAPGAWGARIQPPCSTPCSRRSAGPGRTCSASCARSCAPDGARPGLRGRRRQRPAHPARGHPERRTPRPRPHAGRRRRARGRPRRCRRTARASSAAVTSSCPSPGPACCPRSTPAGPTCASARSSGSPSAPFVVLLGRDVTEARAARQALLASEQRYRRLVEHSSDPILVLTPGGVITYASPAVRAVLHREPDELLGGPVAAIVAPRRRRGARGPAGRRRGRAVGGQPHRRAAHPRRRGGRRAGSR